MLLLAGPAGLALATPAPAAPLFVTPPSALLRLDAPALTPAPAPPPPFWALAGRPLWGRDADPSLRLGDWRRVFDIAALGAFDVPLRDDPAERANILLSARLVDGATLAPGQEFSFNARVGERTPERGFRDGLMFDAGRVVRGTGGGICLIATGLYNAALGAGLAIEERHPHSGVVGYAPPGCDAGIVYGQEDLRFRNTTAKPLVIRARAEGDRVAVRLFGQAPPPGHQVIVKPLALSTIPAAVVSKTDPALPPGQTVVDQTPRAGYDVVVGRFWTVHGRVVRREVVARERRAPRPEIVRVAPPPAPETGAAPPPQVWGAGGEPTPLLRTVPPGAGGGGESGPGARASSPSPPGRGVEERAEVGPAAGPFL